MADVQHGESANQRNQPLRQHQILRIQGQHPFCKENIPDSHNCGEGEIVDAHLMQNDAKHLWNRASTVRARIMKDYRRRTKYDFNFMAWCYNVLHNRRD